MPTADTFAPDAEIDLRQIWNVIFKNKWIIIGLPAVAAIIAKVAVSFIAPIYNATATIMIENNNPNIVSIEQVYGAQRRNAQYFDTQFAILKSRPLAEGVVDKLNIISYPEYDPTPVPTPAWRDWKGWLGIEEEKRRSSLSAERRAVLRYMDNLSVRPVPRTQLVNVSFQSEDPQLAADVANAHAQSYIEGMMEARLGMTETAILWMTAKLDDLQASLSASERRLQEYRELHGVIDFDGIKALPSQEISNLTASLAAARQSVSETRAAYLQVYPGGGDELAENLGGVRAILEDPLSRDFQLSVVSAQSNVDELSKRLGPSHPTMIDAQAALDRANDNLRLQHRRVAEQIKNAFQQANVQESEIEAALDRAKARFQAVGRTEAEFRSLERDVQTNRELYDMFYSRIKETAQTEDLQQSEARILSPAIRPIRRVYPNDTMIVGMAFAASLVLALVAAFVVEALNDKINVNNAESRLGMTMLSMVPLVNGRRKFGPASQLFVSGKHRAFKESLRTLRTAISLSGSDELTKVVLVTSAIGDEGKSTIAINLAQAFAQMERVLLIDADMRKPSIGRRLSLPLDHPGLVEVLSKNAKLEDATIKTVDPNLDILQTGTIPEDALQLLSSRQTSSLMRVLRIQYDRIIVDSPPVLPVSDAPVLSSYADAVIMVAKSKSTSIMQTRAAIAKLMRVSAPVSGVVVNQWDMRDRGSYGDLYGYYEYGPEEPNQSPVKKAAG